MNAVSRIPSLGGFAYDINLKVQSKHLPVADCPSATQYAATVDRTVSSPQ
jgi:hypothetical protein